jgi:hypothetical protein
MQPLISSKGEGNSALLAKGNDTSLVGITTSTRERMISKLICGVPGLNRPAVTTWNAAVSTAPISDVTEQSVNGAGKWIMVAACVGSKNDKHIYEQSITI